MQENNHEDLGHFAVHAGDEVSAHEIDGDTKPTTNVQQALELLKKQAPVKNASVDELADALLVRLATFFGTALQNPDFCGISVDEGFDENGVVFIKFTACDRVAGTEAKRG